GVSDVRGIHLKVCYNRPQATYHHQLPSDPQQCVPSSVRIFLDSLLLYTHTIVVVSVKIGILDTFPLISTQSRTSERIFHVYALASRAMQHQYVYAPHSGK